MISLKHFLFLVFFTTDLVIGTPHSRGKGRNGRPVNRLTVHPLIIKLVEEVEKSGMQQEGLYRLSGSKTEVQKLAQNCFSLDSDISEYNLNVITSYLKSLFRDLRTSLIDEATFNQLSSAMNIEDVEESEMKMKEIITDLPQNIRDTLAYLIVHLQKVVKHHEINRMTAGNIGIVFGPTLMDFKLDDQMAELALNSQKTKIIERLLEISSSFWKELINYETTRTEPNVSNSAEDEQGAWGGAVSTDSLEFHTDSEDEDSLERNLAASIRRHSSVAVEDLAELRAKRFGRKGSYFTKQELP
ncbi:beta-chimaerin-like [Leptopilina heterotoma]|uniref:beta-chimaerin-like n=1 Tax=Leptopilina heterotoma TaxID=63436 RepID=UPI001CAA193D|nr:beta-chimaerin-like [Leptopilina heterotoma]